MKELIRASQHKVTVEGNYMRCTNCAALVPKSTAKEWLVTSCGQSSSDGAGAVKSCDPVQVKKLSTHPTHKLCTFKGIVFCNRCGCRSISHLRKLRIPCKPPTEHGRISLAAIRAGRNPPNIFQVFCSLNPEDYFQIYPNTFLF